MSEVLKSLESLYTQERYAEAVELLQSSQASIPSGQFHYNLGTLYLKLEEYGLARHQLEQALSEGFIHSALLNNLEFVQQKVSVVDLSLSSALWDRVYHFAMSVPQDIYIFVALLCIVLIMVSFKLMKKIKWALSAVLLVFIGVLTYVHFGIVEKNHVAIALSESEVLEGPSNLYKKKYSLPSGAKILLGQNVDGWSYIKRPIHLSGWIRATEVGIIGETK